MKFNKNFKLNIYYWWIVIGHGQGISRVLAKLLSAETPLKSVARILSSFNNHPSHHATPTAEQQLEAASISTAASILPRQLLLQIRRRKSNSI